ncbi:MAG: polymer-forming cytoskeletal protein [Deltaproteobacteria bacterium]|nr:polymer-forming cytoskeletal protein [Deltaproteobacteria bacterium]
MFGEKNLKLVDEEPQTLLDKDAEFEGKLTFEGSVQINGKFQGEIFSSGVLIIGEGAEVDARVEIDTIIIQGKFTGKIKAKRRIEMHPPALVKGDISSPGLVIGEGAIFEGNCSMGKPSEGLVFELAQNERSQSASSPE